MKICSRCRVGKPLGEFSRSKNRKDGYRGQCKECDKVYRQVNREKIHAYRKIRYSEHIEDEKKYYQANKEKIVLWGKQYYKANKEEKREYGKKYYQANKEKVALLHKQYYEANKEEIAAYKKQWAKDNHEERITYHKQWREDNPEKIARLRIIRKIAIKQQCPDWADREAIRAIYLEAQRLTRITGEPHEVDHIIPLQGKYVRGLHIENNLQILTARDNAIKHNKFTIGG